MVNKRERVIRAIEFNRPDRIPIVHNPSSAALRIYGHELEQIIERYPEDYSISHYDFSMDDKVKVGRFTDQIRLAINSLKKLQRR